MDSILYILYSPIHDFKVRNTTEYGSSIWRSPYELLCIINKNCCWRGIKICTRSGSWTPDLIRVKDSSSPLDQSSRHLFAWLHDRISGSWNVFFGVFCYLQHSVWRCDDVNLCSIVSAIVVVILICDGSGGGDHDGDDDDDDDDDRGLYRWILWFHIQQ